MSKEQLTTADFQLQLSELLFELNGRIKGRSSYHKARKQWICPICSHSIEPGNFYTQVNIEYSRRYNYRKLRICQQCINTMLRNKKLSKQKKFQKNRFKFIQRD